MGREPLLNSSRFGGLATAYILAIFALTGCQTTNNHPLAVEGVVLENSNEHGNAPDVADQELPKAPNYGFWYRLRSFFWPDTLGLTITAPQPMVIEITDPKTTIENVLRKYLEAISTAFQQGPLFACPVEDSTVPRNEVKLRRWYEKSIPLKTQGYYEKADYEIGISEKQSRDARDNGSTNAFELLVRVRCTVDISYSRDETSFHNPSRSQFHEYEKAMAAALSNASAKLFDALTNRIFKIER